MKRIITILPRAKANYRFNDEEKAAAEKNNKIRNMILNCIYVLALIAAIASFFIFLPGFILFIGVVFIAASFDPRTSVNVGSNVTGYRTINDKTQKRLIAIIPGICIMTFGLYLSLSAYLGINTIKLFIIFTDIAAVIAFLIFGIGPLIRVFAAESRRRRCTVPAKAEFVSSDVIEPDNESGIGPIVTGCYYSYYCMGDGYKLYVSTKDAKNIDYKGEFDIMTDPGHPERYYNERLMRYDLGKAVKMQCSCFLRQLLS